MSFKPLLAESYRADGTRALKRTNRHVRKIYQRRLFATASNLVAHSAVEIVRRSVSHAGFLAYQQHLTGIAATYHALATLPPLVMLGGLLAVVASVIEIAKRGYECFLYCNYLPNNKAVKDEPYSLHGVDLSKSSYFLRESVQKAVRFAAEVHANQTRLTGEPYVVHCIETALIVEFNLPEIDSDERHEAAVIAAVLHDTMDDAGVDMNTLKAAFGERVASMVVKVSKLSGANQLLRRRKREGLLSLSETEERKLRRELKRMILDMVVEEPLVILIKLADRLHNMRTVYALRQDKQQAVAEETMEVWCSMAERMGWDALKSEMEDVCFAVLEPQRYRELRRDLHRLWGLPPVEDLDDRPGQTPDDGQTGADLPLALPPAAALAEAAALAPSAAAAAAANLWAAASRVASSAAQLPQLAHLGVAVPALPLPHLGGVVAAAVAVAEPAAPQAVRPKQLTPQQQELRALLSTVVPFDVARFSHQARVPRVAAGMRVLDAAAEELLYRIRIGSYSAGLSITVQGRLKSLHSIRKKMGAKALPLEQVYDARGLRIIVDDEGGAAELDAIYVCYRMAQSVMGIWKRIKGQYDDYIANPKPSGYRALHLAVKGPDGRPLEVQIKTSSMHFHAEYGGAAHWAYKEGVPLPSLVPVGDSAAVGPFIGQPVIQIDFSDSFGRFRYGVVVDLQYEGQPNHLLVALRTAGTVREHPFWMPTDFYALLLAYTQDKYLSRGRNRPSDGDLLVRLDEYALCQDGRYHRVDRFGVIQTHTTVNLKRITALDVSPDWYASTARTGGSGQAAGSAAGPRTDATAGGDTGVDEDEELVRSARHSLEIFQKTRLVRSMIEGLEELRVSSHAATQALQCDEVSVLIWPEGRIMHFPKGTTAGAVVRERGRIDIMTADAGAAAATSAEDSSAAAPAGTPADASVLPSVDEEVVAIEWDGPGSGGRDRPTVPAMVPSVILAPTRLATSRALSAALGGEGDGSTAEGPDADPATALTSLEKALAEMEAGGGGAKDSARSIAREVAVRVPWESIVNVNNRLVHESTPLEDGDLVILSREILKI